MSLAVLLAAGAAAEDLAGAQVEAGRLLSELKSAQAVELRAPQIAPSVRFPTWELGALIAQDAFAGSASRLTDREKTIARNVYADAIDLDAVRVVYAPTVTGAAMTWGDTIRLYPSQKFSTGTIIHELAHVWQYQTRGTPYISDSMLKQTCMVLSGRDRDEAYKYVIVEGQSLLEYPAEHQAQILEDYALSPKKQADPRYKALVDEARRNKAIKGHAEAFLERDFGPSPRHKAVPPAMGREAPFNGEAGGVPQFEIRF